MKLFLKWSVLTDAQQSQVLAAHKQDLEDKEITRRDLMRRKFLVNPTNGIYIHRKDF